MYNSYFGQPNNYGSVQYQPMTNQPAQPTFQSPTQLPGMVVNDISSVGPENVPMNGKPCVFPLADGSAVYVKMWNPQGGISTVKYVPEVVKVNNTPNYESLANNLSVLTDRVKNIEAQLGLGKEEA